MLGEDNPKPPDPGWARVFPWSLQLGVLEEGLLRPAGKALQRAHTLVLSAAGTGQEQG